MSMVAFAMLGQMRIGILTVMMVFLAVLIFRAVWQMNTSGKGHVYHPTYRFNAIASLVILIVVGFFEVNYQTHSYRLTTTVQEVTEDRNLYVRCQRVADTFFDAEIGTLGYVSWDKRDEAVLKWSTCKHLREYMQGDKSTPSREHATAVHILTHETRHQLGEQQEAKAECEAIQRNYKTAMSLGATPEEATTLAMYYYTELYPMMPKNYRHSNCTQGGLWDESPEDNTFPLDLDGIIPAGAIEETKELSDGTEIELVG